MKSSSFPYLAAMDASSCAITLADARKKDFPLVYVNRTFETITGYKKSEVLGKNCRFLQGKKKKPKAATEIRNALREKRACQVILENYRKNGQPFWNELRIAPVFAGTGILTHFIGVQTDVTERLKTEKALETYKNELELRVKERTQKLEEKNIALQEIMDQIRQEKKRTTEQIGANLERLVFPMLDQLTSQAQDTGRQYLELIKTNLQQLSEGFGVTISSKLYKLTPKEIQISNMIRQGMSTKDIADYFHVSKATVENQRNSLRKKFGISQKDINLVAFLQSL